MAGTFRVGCWCLLAGILVAHGTVFADPLVVIGKSWQDASLVSIDEQRLVTFTTENQQLSKPLSEVVRFGHPAKPSPRYAHILLVDGSQLVGFLEGIDRTSVELDCVSLGLVTLNRRYVKAVIFQPPTNEQLYLRLVSDVTKHDAQDDTLLLGNGDTITGEFLDLSLQGLDPVVRFKTPVGPITLNGTKIRASRLTTSEQVDASRAAAWVGFSDGSRVAVQQIVTDQGQLTLSPLIAPTKRWKARLSNVCFLQPNSAQVRYLSTFTPATYRHIPFLETKRTYFADRNCLGKPLQSSEQLYMRGIGMPTTALLVYRIPAGAKQFAAQIALDDAAPRSGSVNFRVLLDGKAAFTSPIIRAGDQPQNVSVNVDGFSTLTLITLFAERGDAGDYANWLDARFER